MVSRLECCTRAPKCVRKMVELLVNPPKEDRDRHGTQVTMMERSGSRSRTVICQQTTRHLSLVGLGLQFSGIWGCERYRKTTKAYALHFWPLACAPFGLAYASSPLSIGRGYLACTDCLKQQSK